MPFRFNGGRRAIAALLRASALVPAAAFAQTAPAEQSSAVVNLPDIMVTGARINVFEHPTGQTATTIERDRFDNTQAFSVNDILRDSPGVSMKQGNGPRDVGISIRGSNARNGFGVRNVVIFDDGFPVTQPDGLSRTDLVDPHAYGGIDVICGPSSTLFGNYATGGALNFRTRSGREIDGFEYGVDAGSFGYLNNYIAAGKQSGHFEASLFASDVRGDGQLPHSSFDTQTVNALASYQATPDDKFTVKLINNTLFGNLSNRLSLDQFNRNPLQRGCATPAGVACATVSLFNNGFNSANGTTAVTGDQGGFNRDDRRTIVGARWEHNFDKDTMWRTQFVFDDRNINQPTGATAAIGDFPSYNVISDLTKHGSIAGAEATHFIGFNWNFMKSNSDTVHVMPGGGPNLGRLSSNTNGTQWNIGGRIHEELRFDDHWTMVAGVGGEVSHIDGVLRSLTYTGTTPVVTEKNILADRDFYNTAPEFALQYRMNPAWQFRGRIGAGYGTPNVGQLFVTPTGAAGNNTALGPQRNIGYDAGFDWTPSNAFKLSVTGFYEFFRDEIVTQSPGIGLQSFSFNAPRSEHRGVEVAADWRPGPGWRFTAAYTYMEQFYREYDERVTTGAVSALFNRAGNKIPGISPNELTARLGYDQPDGLLKGFGGFIEYVWKDAFFMDNGNLLQAPSYNLINLNLHYNKELNDSYLKSARFFFEVRNLFDVAYVASANNVTNTVNGAGAQNPATVLAISRTGSIYAGSPRFFVGGVKVAFK